MSSIRRLVPALSVFFMAAHAFGVVNGTPLRFTSDPDLDLIRRSTVRFVYQNEKGQFRTFCTGVLTGPGEVLSAAHCAAAVPGPLDNGLVFAEVYDPSSPLKPKRIQVANWKANDSQYPDLALFRLAFDAPLQQSIPIAFSGCDPGSEYKSPGFGLIANGKTSPSARLAIGQELTKTDILEVVMRSENSEVADQQNWVNYKPSSGTTCLGDSGGPIFCKSRGRLAIASVVAIIGRNRSFIPEYDRTFESCKQVPFISGHRLLKQEALISRWRREMDMSASKPAGKSAR